MERQRYKGLEYLYIIKVANRFKIACYNLMIVYVILMVTTKKIPMEDTQKEMRMESKHVTTKNK